MPEIKRNLSEEVIVILKEEDLIDLVEKNFFAVSESGNTVALGDRVSYQFFVPHKTRTGLISAFPEPDFVGQEIKVVKVKKTIRSTD